MQGLTVNAMDVTQATMVARDGSGLQSLRGLGNTGRASRSGAVGDASAATGRERLVRKRVNELVGQTFYGTLLRTMRSSPLKAPYGHGGRGEDAFQGQLDMLLAERMGQAKQFKLNDAIYRSLMKGAAGSVKRAVAEGKTS
jgi:hypothetical protein